jgi:hypothetical protein
MPGVSPLGAGRRVGDARVMQERKSKSEAVVCDSANVQPLERSVRPSQVVLTRAVRRSAKELDKRTTNGGRRSNPVNKGRYDKGCYRQHLVGWAHSDPPSRCAGALVPNDSASSPSTQELSCRLTVARAISVVQSRNSQALTELIPLSLSDLPP